MNWRRGILLAAIHLAVAVPLIVHREAALWNYLYPQIPPPPVASPPPVAIDAIHEDGEEQTVSFMPDPCDLWAVMSDREKILEIANFPSLFASGWGDRCNSTLPVARFFAAVFGQTTRRAEVGLAIVFSILIPLQWLLMGGFPIFRPSRWYWEPAILITGCTVLSVTLLALPAKVGGAALPMGVVCLVWPFYILTLLFFSGRHCWRFSVPFLRKPPIRS